MAGVVTSRYSLRRGKLLVSLCLLSVSWLPLQAVAERSPSFSCAEVIGQSHPATPQEWLVMSMYAGHCVDFQARAVSIDTLGVRTLALSHRIRDGVRQQVVQHLDGPSINVERRSIAGFFAWFPSDTSEPGASPQRWSEHVAEYYDVSQQDDTRVAERDAVALRFSPIDSQRYSHAWWVDKETGLLLKQEISDAQGRVLETFQVTQLHSPSLYSGDVVHGTDVEMPDYPWQVSWLPEGFVEQPSERGQAQDSQRVYSDGMTAISVFAKPLSSQPLEEGVHRLGVSTAVVSQVTFDEQRWQLIVIGELPRESLKRIANSLTFESNALDG